MFAFYLICTFLHYFCNVKMLFQMFFPHGSLGLLLGKAVAGHTNKSVILITVLIVIIMYNWLHFAGRFPSATWTQHGGMTRSASSSQSASTESALGHSAVKPFAICRLDTPTFLQWRDNGENVSAVEGKEQSCCTRWSVLILAAGRWTDRWRIQAVAAVTVQVAASGRCGDAT